MEIQKLPHPVMYFTMFQDLIAISIEKNIEIYNVQTWKLLHKLYHNRFTYKLVFLSSSFLVSADGHFLSGWDLLASRQTRSCIHYGKKGWTRPLERVVHLQYLDDTLLVGCRTGHLYTLSPDDGTIQTTLVLPPFRSMSKIGDNILILTEDEHSVHLFHPSQPVPILSMHDPDEYHYVKTSPDQRYIVVTKAQAISLYNLSFQCLWTHLHDYPLPNISICFSGDGRMVAAVGPRFKRIQIFATHSGRVMQSFWGHTSIIFTMSFQGLNHLITSSFDQTIRTWTILDTKPLCSLFYQIPGTRLSRHLRLKLLS